MKKLLIASLILSILACLNYGILAVFDYDVLKHLFVNYPGILKIVYLLFGMAGFANILQIKR